MCPRFNRPCYAGMLHNSTSSPSKPTGDLGLLYFTLLYLARALGYTKRQPPSSGRRQYTCTGRMENPVVELASRQAAS